MALEELALVTGQSDVADATAYQVGAPATCVSQWRLSRSLPQKVRSWLKS